MANYFPNTFIAEYLTNIATAYEILHKSHFRIIAYENAADTILTYPEELYSIWQKDPKELDLIPNIGPAILKKIDYLFKTGKIYPPTEKILDKIHPAVFVFTKINGIGPLIAQKLIENFKFSKKEDIALEQLIHYCKQGKIEKIPTFGKKSQESILKNTLSFLGRQKRLPLKDAQKIANKIISYLKKYFPETEFVTLGSLRRSQPSVGDIDIAAASTNSKEIIDQFLKYPDSVQTIIKGKNKASLRLLHNVHVDLMVKPKNQFGALSQHFTGSRQHNIILRKHALKMGYSLSEYGIKNLKTGKTSKFDNEIDFYKFLNLKWIPPEERLGEGELSKYKMV